MVTNAITLCKECFANYRKNLTTQIEFLDFDKIDKLISISYVHSIWRHTGLKGMEIV